MAALLSLALLPGCTGGDPADAPQRAAVSGTVALDGESLAAGTIVFVPTAGTTGPKSSVAIVDGKFQLSKDTGPVVGLHRIEIKAAEGGELAMDDEAALERLHSQGRHARITVLQIPAAYNSNSKLIENVYADVLNQLDFSLNSKTNQ